MVGVDISCRPGAYFIYINIFRADNGLGPGPLIPGSPNYSNPSCFGISQDITPNVYHATADWAKPPGIGNNIGHIFDSIGIFIRIQCPLKGLHGTRAAPTERGSRNPFRVRRYAYGIFIGRIMASQNTHSMRSMAIPTIYWEISVA